LVTFHDLKPFTLYGFIIALGGVFIHYYSRLKARIVRVFQSMSEKSSMLKQEDSRFAENGEYEPWLFRIP